MLKTIIQCDNCPNSRETEPNKIEWDWITFIKYAGTNYESCLPEKYHFCSEECFEAFVTAKKHKSL